MPLRTGGHRPAHGVPLSHKPKPTLRDQFGPVGKSGNVQGADFLYAEAAPRVFFSDIAGVARKEKCDEIKTVGWEIERTPMRCSALKTKIKRTQRPTWVGSADGGMYDVVHKLARDGVPSQPGRYNTDTAVARGKSLARGVVDQPNFFTRGFGSPVPRFSEKRLSAKKKIKMAKMAIAAKRATKAPQR